MPWLQTRLCCSLLVLLGACEALEVATPSARDLHATASLGSQDEEDDDEASILPLSRFTSRENRRACEGRGYGDFDFWRGRWNVTNWGETDIAGTNVVTSAQDGCALEEHWSDLQGVRGRSLNAFDATTDTWHQLWMDQSGGALELGGSGGGGRMQMAGTHPTSRVDPTPFTDRITWTRADDQRVRQLGESSVDGGPFTTIYDLSYQSVRREAPIAPSPLEFCSSPARPRYHAFDFMLGEWSVRRDGIPSKLRSNVSTDLGGCLVEERIRGPRGYEAVAYSGFRSVTFVWNWMFMDNRGVQLLLSGPATLTGTSMTLSGKKRDQHGTVVDVRVDWISTDPSTVEQRWSFSSDGGATWTVPEVVVMAR